MEVPSGEQGWDLWGVSQGPTGTDHPGGSFDGSWDAPLGIFRPLGDFVSAWPWPCPPRPRDKLPSTAGGPGLPSPPSRILVEAPGDQRQPVGEAARAQGAGAHGSPWSSSQAHPSFPAPQGLGLPGVG